MYSRLWHASNRYRACAQGSDTKQCALNGLYNSARGAHALFYHLGDFHFLWECLEVIFEIFWSSPSHQGSLCNLREIQRVQVDKGAKVFNVADEFLVHVFKANLSASVCTSLKVQSTSESWGYRKVVKGNSRNVNSWQTRSCQFKRLIRCMLFIDHFCTWASYTMI